MTGGAGSPSVAPATAGPRQQTKRRWADLMPRVASACVMAIVAVASAWTGGPIFLAFWLAAAVAILWEWQHLLGAAGVGRRVLVGALALAIAAALLAFGLPGWACLVLLGGTGAVAGLAPGGWRVWSGFGLLYAGALLVSLGLLRSSAAPFGARAVLWLFAVVWTTDVMAYFGGRLIGGPKLWPRLSPSKTWSGFVVGVGCGALAGVVVSPEPRSYAMAVLIGLAAAALAQGGDLFESSLKRRFNVKDASGLIPGHGGVMDRLDGFIAAAVFAALLGVARLGVEAAGAGLFQ